MGKRAPMAGASAASAGGAVAAGGQCGGTGRAAGDERSPGRCAQAGQFELARAEDVITAGAAGRNGGV